jgi:hypothetical protein
MGEMLRFNTGKAQLSYLPSSFWRALGDPEDIEYNTDMLQGIAKVLEFGAIKYAKDNWRTSGSWCKCADSGLRHLMWYADGELCDGESNLPHLAHFGCNLAFLIEFQASNSGIDDRYKRPKSHNVFPVDPERSSLAIMFDLMARWLESEDDAYLSQCLQVLNHLYAEESVDVAAQ